MTDTHPFFKLIWRINAILMFFSFFLAIGVLLYVSREIVDDIFGIRNVSDIVNIEENEQIHQHWSLTSTDEVYGTPYFILSLQLEQSYEQSYYEKYSVSIRNYLFIDTQQNSKHHWLFDTNDYLIPHKDLLLDPTRDENQPNKTVAILYEVIAHDSNGDARLSDSDLHTVGLSKPDGSDYKAIMDNVDAVLSYKMLDSNTLMLLCRAENHISNDVGVFSLHVDVNNFTILNKVKLPVLLQ